MSESVALPNDRLRVSLSATESSFWSTVISGVEESIAVSDGVSELAAVNGVETPELERLPWPLLCFPKWK